MKLLQLQLRRCDHYS